MAGEEPLHESFPIFEETARIDKTVRETDRLLIRTSVQDRTEFVDLDLRSGEAVVDRVPVNRVVESAPPIREEGDTVIVPLLEEVLVVQKKLVLREELHIRRNETLKHVHQPVRLRSEEVLLERTPVTATSRKDET